MGGNRIDRAFCHSGDSNTAMTLISMTYRSHERNKQLKA